MQGIKKAIEALARAGEILGWGVIKTFSFYTSLIWTESGGRQWFEGSAFGEWLHQNCLDYMEKILNSEITHWKQDILEK